MRFCLTRSNITDYGLGFFFEVLKDLVISKEFIETLYRVIIKIARTKYKQILPLPEMPVPDETGAEPSEEAKAAVQKQIDDISKVNAQAEKDNEEIAKIQSKVKIAYRPLADQKNEVALMRVNNFRMQQAEESLMMEHNASYEQNVSQNSQLNTTQRAGSSMAKEEAKGKNPSATNTSRDQFE